MSHRLFALVLCVMLMCVAPYHAEGMASSPAREQSRGSSSKSRAAKTGGKGNKASGKNSGSTSGKSGGGKKSGNKNVSTGTSSGKKGSTCKKRQQKSSSAATPVAGQSAAEVKRLQEATQKEITDTKRQLKENEISIKKGVDELGRLQGDIGDARRKVEAAASEVSAIDSRISGLESQVASEEKQLDKLRSEYLKAIKKMRAAGKNNSTLAFVFSSGSFHQALRRMRYLREFSDWKERQSVEITKKVDHLKSQRDLLARSRAEMDAALRRQQSAHRELQNQYARQDAIVVELRANGAALNAHLAKKQAEANALRSRISALIAAEEQARRQREEAEARERRRQEEAAAERAALAKAEEERAAAERAAAEKNVKSENIASSGKGKGESGSKNVSQQQPQKDKGKKKDTRKQVDSKNVVAQNSNNKGGDYANARKRKPRSDSGNSSGNKGGTEATAPSRATSPAPAAGGSFEKMRGSLPRPVSGSFRVTSPFGRHALPELPDVVYDNPGIDAQVASGATAQAVYAGKVSGVYVIPGFSTVVIVNHGNYYTVYGNIASPAVKVGDSVKQGQGLGRLAVDEDDSGHSSIHFEVWRNREKLNPSDWIK